MAEPRGGVGAPASVRVLGPGFGLTVFAFAPRIAAPDLCPRGLEWPPPFPTLLGRPSPLPGGVGVAGAAMVGVLVAGSEPHPAVALFGVASGLFDARPGTLGFFARHGEREAAGA